MKVTTNQPAGFNPIELKILIESQSDLEVMKYLVARDSLPAFHASKQQNEVLGDIARLLERY